MKPLPTPPPSTAGYVMLIVGNAVTHMGPACPTFLRGVKLDADNPTGSLVDLTEDPTQALIFPNAAAVFVAWKESRSTTVPTRPDGLPNRPLTAYHVMAAPLTDYIPGGVG